VSDHYLKTRAVGYFNNLLTGSEADFQKLLRKYAICPPNKVANFDGVNVGTAKTGLTAPNRAFLQGVNLAQDIRLAQMDANHLVAYIDLRLGARQEAATVHNLEGGDRVYFDASYAQAATHVPVYFLPWDSLGASVRMTIPTMATNNPDPDIFFTAAINGCSIFFQGTEQNPTIYHCGGTTGYQKSEIAEAIGFWQDVVDEFIDQDATAGRPNLGALNARSVDKAQYVATPGVKSKSDVKMAGGKIKSYTTKTALSYQRLLKAKHGLTSITIEEVGPWACVLGRRDAHGDWKFFLQENATITYHKVTRSLPNLFKGTKSPSVRIARPLQWRQIFPSDQKHHSVQAPIPKIQ
jgi:hypothetical protein